MNNELISAAKLIRDWQRSQNLSDVQLLKKFPGLGSTKTFTRIVDGDLADLDIERWLMEYRQALALIEALAEGGSDDEPLYDDLTTCARLRLAALDAMKEKGNNRLIIGLGGPGSGKSSAARVLAAKYGSRIVLVEADETWKKNVNNFLAGMLRALGVRDFPASADARWQRLLERLREGDRCLVIDEAHHMGVPAFNMVKSLLNQTNCQIILLALPVLFRRIEMAAWEEVRQLTQNRLLERIRFDGIQASDIEKFIGRRCGWDNGEIKRAAAAVKEPASRYGHLAFLKLVCRKAKKLADGETVTLDHFLQAVKLVTESR
jgi:hypothetical protein